MVYQLPVLCPVRHWTRGCNCLQMRRSEMGKPTFDQLGEFHDLAETGQVTSQNFQAYLRNPNAYLTASMEIVSPTFRILTVTIDRERKYEKARDAGEYDYTNPDITLEKFPRSRGKDVVKVRVGVFTLGRNASDEEVVAHREQLNLLPIGMEHEFAVGEQFKDLQRELGWIANRDVLWADAAGYRHFSCLRGGAVYRSLDVSGFDGGWGVGWWFFGLCK